MEHFLLVSLPLSCMFLYHSINEAPHTTDLCPNLYLAHLQEKKIMETVSVAQQ